MRLIHLFNKDLRAMLGSSKLSILEKSSLSHGAGLMKGRLIWRPHYG